MFVRTLGCSSGRRLTPAIGVQVDFSRATSSGPLAGIRVLELEGLAAAPMCGMLLADFGAEVIRVDRLKAPHIATTCLGRGKKSIALDLKSADGLAAFRKLAKSVDVLIEPYRPGVMERLQLGPDELCMENPGLIYARLTGTIHCVWVKMLVLVPLLLLVRCYPRARQRII
jgi:crotonobetainyl-CoA:carnitine CoA-transferase CaiB-like acyl-CoA transferase